MWKVSSNGIYSSKNTLVTSLIIFCSFVMEQICLTVYLEQKDMKLEEIPVQMENIYVYLPASFLPYKETIIFNQWKIHIIFTQPPDFECLLKEVDFCGLSLHVPYYWKNGSLSEMWFWFNSKGKSILKCLIRKCISCSVGVFTCGRLLCSRTKTCET